jgi:hypothetical protein
MAGRSSSSRIPKSKLMPICPPPSLPASSGSAPYHFASLNDEDAEKLADKVAEKLQKKQADAAAQAYHQVIMLFEEAKSINDIYKAIDEVKKWYKELNGKNIVD